MNVTLQISIMKNYLFLSIIILVVSACEKKEAKNSVGKKQNEFGVTGTWELRQLSGQIGTKQFAVGNGITITFTDNAYAGSGKEFGIFGRNNFPLNGNFEIVEDSSVKESVGLEIPAGEFRRRFVLNSDTTEKFFFHIKGNQLRILSGYFPLDSGVELVYEKQ